MVRTLLTMAAVMVAGPAAATDDPLTAYRWKARVVVIASPSADDPHLMQQRATLSAMPSGLRERDIVVVEAVGDGEEARRWRARLGLPKAAFRVVLVGKDGEVKRSEARSLSAETLFETIDAMPMRRDEMRR